MGRIRQFPGLYAAQAQVPRSTAPVWNGQALETSFKIDMQGNALEFNDSSKLSDDGKVLTIVRGIYEHGSVAAQV